MNDYSRYNTDSDGADGLAASARTLAAHAEELLQSTAAISSESVAAVRKKLTESLRVAREQLSSAQDYAKQRGQEAVDMTDSYVHENPWPAIAAAALLGAAIGFMSRGSRG